VASAVRIRDRLIIADAGAQQLGFYSLDGTQLRTVGREGSGPGEFRHLAWVGRLPGDSVIAWDARLRRLSVYSLDGELARTAELVAVKGLFPAVHGVFGDGSLLVAAGIAGAPPSGAAAWRDTAVFVRVASTGELRDTLGRFPGPEQYQVPSGERTRLRTHALPFGRETFAAVHEDRAFMATGDGYDITAYDQRGRQVNRLRGRVDRRPVTASDIRAYRTDVLANVGAADAPEWAAALDAAPFPSHMPALAGLTVSDAGHVWIREHQPAASGDEESRWMVFDAALRPIALARGPAAFQLFQIGPDWVLGRHVDADGEEHVLLYSLTRP
jgi:hypothetical protein